NASYCISHTGRQPAMHSPTAVPRMPASASGVSTQRFSPKRSRRPAVARKTPPARPTSSPMTITVSSRSSSTRSASLIASTRSSSAKPALPEIRRRENVCMLEHELRIGLGLGLRIRDALAHRLERLRLERFLDLVGEDAQLAQVPLVPAEALVLLFPLNAFEVDVRARVVRGGVRRRAIRHRLDERRALAGMRALDRLAGHLVHGEDVAAVDPNAGHAVTDRL